MCFILIKTVETFPQTSSTVFILLLNIHTFPTIPHLQGKTLKGEEMMDCPFFPFPFMLFSVESVANSGEGHK